MATPKRAKSGRFKKDGKPNRKPRAKAKRRPKARAKTRAKRGATRATGLESRVNRLEANVEVLHGVSTATVNVIRKSQGAAPLKKLSGYVSPLGRKTAPHTRQLGPGR